MLAKINSFGLSGIDGYVISVEIDIGSGLPGMDIVGLPDTATKESKERVRSALKNSGFRLSPQRITVNLAPADMRKEGSAFDLPIALGILCATEQLSCKRTEDVIFVGELSLNGDIGKVTGILPIILAAKERGYRRAVIPSANADEASYVSGIDVYAFNNLRDVAAYLEGAEASPVSFRDPAQVVGLKRKTLVAVVQRRDGRLYTKAGRVMVRAGDMEAVFQRLFSGAYSKKGKQRTVFDEIIQTVGQNLPLVLLGQTDRAGTREHPGKICCRVIRRRTLIDIF